MAQNQFSGGYQVNEQESQLADREGERQEDLKNIQPGGGVYKAFDEKNITQVDKTPEERDNTINNPDDILGRLDDTPDSHFEENETLNTFKDSPHYPLLLGLEKSGQIDQSIFNSAVEQLGDANKEEEGQIIRSAVMAVKNGDTKAEILDHLEGNTEDVTEDTFEKTEFYSHAQDLNIGLDNGIGGLELLLANEFMSIPDIEGNTNITNDMERTMDIVSKIIIQKNSPDFKKLNAEVIAKIGETSDISEKYSLMKTLYEQDLKADAKLGGKKSRLEIAQKQQSLKKKASEVSQQIAEGKIYNSKNSEEIAQLEKKILTIIAEAQDLDIFEGEVFSAGDFDTYNESLPQKNEQTA